MEHFYNDIQGWFSYHNLYKKMVSEAKDGFHFVEVGTWLGCSAVYMAVEIINSNKNIRFDCVDTWEGSAEHASTPEVINKTLYSDFLKNIEPVKHVINPIKMASTLASKLYKDDSLDFVFIDASHDYENVKKDAYAWLAKVKPGGILSGHDYGLWGEVTRAINDFVAETKYELFVRGEEVCWGIIKK